MVPRLIRHVERHRFARERVAIPIRQLEVIEPADQPGAVVNARPRGLANPIRALPPPTLQIVSIMDLNLANDGVLRQEAEPGYHLVGSSHNGSASPSA